MVARTLLTAGLTAGLIGALVGCTTISTLDGATTLDRGELQLAAAASIQGGTNSVSTATLIPIPQADLALRVGVGEHTDIGARLYLGGGSVDLRYRFFQSETWDLAVAPAVAGLALPIGGVLDVRAPVRAERGFGALRESGQGPRLVLGITPMGRTTFANIAAGSTAHTELYLGGVARVQIPAGPVYLGFSLDVMAQPARGLAPAYSLGMDVSLRKGPFTRRKGR